MRQPIVSETRVVKCDLPRHSKRWRWDITWQQPIEGRHPGIYDTRLHQRGQCGYTYTAWGAWRALRRAYQAALGQVDQ